MAQCTYPASVDALASCAVSVLKIAALHHEALDHSMKDRALVVERLASHVPSPLLSSAEGTEVLACQWALFREQLEDDTPSCGA